MTHKLLRWNNLLLSQSMKVFLINLVEAVMISHILGTFTIPATTSNKIDSFFHSFLWSFGGHPGIHWIKKEISILPKGMGGLGVRSIKINESSSFDDASLEAAF